MEERLNPDMTLQGTARIPDHVVRRSFDDQMVLLNLETGRYHGLNWTGGRMLDLLDQYGSVRVALGHLAEDVGREPDEIADDLAEFLVDLAQRGLLEIESGDPNGDG